MAKRFRVNLTRTITVECTMVVASRNGDDAAEKVRSRADDGKLGEPHVTFKEFGKKTPIDFDDINVSESIDVEDAFEEEE